ncbi:MAG: hypothetical protein NT127_08735 [Sphingobacteriales bacterium]|nr:hypothetical protein [Sphingobacteriales bacterium]
MIPQEYRDFGLVTVPSYTECCFQVWRNQYEFEQIQCSETPRRAYWSGNSIIVEMREHTRVYHGLGTSDYTTIYN